MPEQQLNVDNRNVAPAENYAPQDVRNLHGTDEILWFDDGRWGGAGYAIPNAGLKTWTENDTIYTIHDALGRTLFDVMHRQAVQLSEPPHVDIFFDLHQALTKFRKRLRDRQLTPGGQKRIDPQHIQATPKTFLVYPVPFFGKRIRQADLREYCQMALILLSEMMQHSANEKQYYISDRFADMCIGYINEIVYLFATKYFGYKGEEVLATEDFVIDPERFTEQNYRPYEETTSVERSEERPPQQWWPTENELSAINGIQYTTAFRFAKRWPRDIGQGEGDWESTLPGLVNRVGSGDPVAGQVSQTQSVGEGVRDNRRTAPNGRIIG